jgi:putative inorganic carbon (HCO3(-)) transporter
VIAAVTALGTFAQTAGVVVAALLAAAVLLAQSDRSRAAAMLGALALTPVLLVANIWSSPQIAPLRERPLLALAAAGAGIVLLTIGAVVFARRPALVALAAAAALPFRVPIAAGGDTSNLLVPLYLVIAAGVLAYAVPRLRATPGLDDDDDEPAHARGTLEWLLAATVVLYAAQAAYSSDFDRALSQVIFFYVPFALLYALLIRIEWTPQLAGRCLVVLLVLAVAFVGIGFVEYDRRELLLNPKVISSNQFESYFRVNSLFFDPNIYGRFLATVMLGITAVLLWSRRTALVAGCAAALAFLWAGLVLTLSQSSFTALLAGLTVLGALRWGARRAAAIVAVFVVAGVLVVLAAPGAVGLDQSTNKATSGRSNLVSGGLALAEARPIEGWGAGAFRHEYRRHEKASNARASAASHTIPITVAAEQGIGGLVLYLALLFVAIGGLLRGARTSIARAAIAAAFVALVVHTLLYAAFLEDPLAWALLAVGAALARGEAAAAADDPPPRDRDAAHPGDVAASRRERAMARAGEPAGPADPPVPAAMRPGDRPPTAHGASADRAAP